MSYVNRLQQQHPSPRAAGAKDAGTELYENMCMNAVNQSIGALLRLGCSVLGRGALKNDRYLGTGRAIRHRADWAALVLVDGRYASPRIRGKLPNWIEAGTVATESFGQAMKELGRFYREKRGG